MKKDKLTVKIFSHTDELPDIVQEKKREAYQMIYEQAALEASGSAEEKKTKPVSFRIWHIPKAAAIMLACFLLTGSAAAAAVGLFTRGEQLKNMDQDTIKQYYEEIRLGGNLACLSTRALTKEEQDRYLTLDQRYKHNEAFPEYEITRLSENEAYSGKGVCLQITETGEENILCLPDTTLTDEELMTIIQYYAKQYYSLYETNKLQALEKGNWESRLAAMTDEEVDFYYTASCSCITETSGGFCRRAADSSLQLQPLSDSEASRYETLFEKYKKENLFPTGETEISVIELPADYTDSGIAICRYDGNYYLPNRELTDEELLEIIDFEIKSSYTLDRIWTEIQIGLRESYPKLPFSSAQFSLVDVSILPFAGTAGKGSLQDIANARIGDMIYFGSYEQDNDPENGREKIEWYVLDQSEDSMTLLSVKILDGRPFSDEAVYTTWEDSSLRKWLNDEFLETAFSQQEQAQILPSELRNGSNPDTSDFVYLLSFEELCCYFGIDQEAMEELNSIPVNSANDGVARNLHCYEILDPRIFTEATETARADGLWYWTEEHTKDIEKFHHLDLSCASGKSSWWLRTPYELQTPSAYTVYADGAFDSKQYIDDIQGVRPVIRICY